MTPRRDLPVDRLGTTAADGSRVYLFPAEVRGRFRSLRSRLYDVLLLIFLGLPWLRIDGHQALLLDIPARRFHIFGLIFWGHDAPILFFLIVGFVVTIGLVTAVFGRAWCGWACPQTVFIDRVYGRIERWIEGDSVARQRLAARPMDAGKFAKRLIKWVAFLAASLVVTHSFLAYFVGTDRLAHMITRPPTENWTSFLVIAVTTAVILFDFGWFREQFCVIACPYGRLQSVLMDGHSMIVAYDEKRGEPRRAKNVHVPGAAPAGDCVDCFRCVQVCPTGIDIRRGLQMECVACTACMDACDEVMKRTGRPPGLIRYASENSLRNERVRHVRVRTVIYAAAVLLLGTGLFFSVTGREALRIGVVRAGEDPYQIVGDGKFVMNHYKFNIRNQSGSDLSVRIGLPEELRRRNFSVVTPLDPMPLASGRSERTDVFVTFPRDFRPGPGRTVDLTISASSNDVEKYRGDQPVPLIAPRETR